MQNDCEQRKTITLPQKKTDPTKGSADETENAGELAEYPKIILKETDSVWSGFEDLEDYEGVSVPVVNNEEEKLLVGAVYTSVFVKTYRQSIHDTRENEKSQV